MSEDGEPQQIATLRAGERLDGVFACVRKERQIARSGNPYLTVELRDSTGSVTGRVFKDADLHSGRFERGQLVHVIGRVERFRDDLQVTVEAIKAAKVGEEEIARFLPASRQDLDELEGFLEHLVREIYDAGLRALCERLLRDKAVRSGLRKAPCGIRGESSRSGGARHHAYLGGLLEHTVSVTSMAVELCSVHPRLDRDLLICSSILHDMGRTREFTYGSEIGRTEEGRLLGHIELGLRLIGGHAPSSLSRERLLSLEHCVAMHHGPERGSEVGFASPEAVALHRLNALDSSVKGALERGLGRSQDQ